MATQCESCPLRKLDCFASFSDSEVRFMQKFKVGELVLEPHTQFLMEGANSPQLFTALRGMGLRYKILENGRRQVLNFVFPGDFLGLQAGLLGEMKHSVEATTHMTLCVFDRNELWSFYRQHPNRAYDITWAGAVEEHFLGEAVASLGQRDARQRIAWALVRIMQRADALGLADGHTVPMPYRQQDLADALGLSLVHTNKTLAKFRERQIASWSDGALQINDYDQLRDIAMVSDTDHVHIRPLM